jgi:CzcA family heavy metal efflux pump
MIRSLITFSLRYPLVVVLLSIAVLVAGGLRLRDAKWDVFPEFAPPQIVVQTEAPGFSTDEVEQLIAVPVEAALSGVSRLKTLRSSSVSGLSVVTAIFEEGTNVLAARQLVSERLTEVRKQLPEIAETPRLMPLTASTSRLLMVGLTADDKVSGQELRTLADWTFRRRLQAVPGVAHVEVFGGDVKQYQVLVAADRLQEYGVTLDEVLTAARSATGFGGAGFIETPNQRLAIRQRTRLEGPDDLAAVPAAVRDGVALPLGHVADVRLGAADRVGSTTINGDRGVLLIIHKQPDFNTLTVTASVQSALDELQTTLPPGVTLHPGLFRQAAFIERAIGNLSSSLVLGCVFVTTVLIAFLYHWRVVLISLTAIPLSLLGAILVLLGSGASLNAMTLGGLAIALGEVVDDAIVDVENVLRRLHENRAMPNPRPVFDVILAASLEVRSAVVYASFIVMLAFLPVFFLEGLAGKLFGPLGAAYVIAILMSLVVALTVTPAMCLLLLSQQSPNANRETWLVRACNAVYRRMLPPVVRRPVLTIIAAIMLLAGTGAVLPFLGGEFLPDFRESNFVIFMAGKSDSSLVESERMGKQLATQLLQIRGVRSVAQQIGRADLSEDTWGPNISEVWVTLDDRADYDTVLAEVRVVLDDTPGYVFQAKQFLRERIDEVLTGSTADLVIRVVGPDLDVLRTKADDVAKAIRDVRGVKDLRIEQLVDVPQIEVLLKPKSVAGYGFSVGQTNHALQTLLRGTHVGQVYEADTVFDVVVRAVPEARSDPHSLGDLLLDSPTGERIPLRALADIGIVSAPNMINREQGRRRLLVTCNAEGRDVASVMTEIQQRLRDRVTLPATGYHFEFAGEFAAKSEAQQRMFWLGTASLVGIFVLLYLDFQSLKLSLLVMLSVPLACVGGVLSVLLSGGDVSLGSLVGFVTVFGIAIRNGILLISNYQHLQQQGHPFGPELILKGSVERLAAILMTAGVTALAIVPLVVAGNLPGHEIEHPMAVVIMGGLLSSTLLTLFVLPSLYLAVAGRPLATERAPTVLQPASSAGTPTS